MPGALYPRSAQLVDPFYCKNIRILVYPFCCSSQGLEPPLAFLSRKSGTYQSNVLHTLNFPVAQKACSAPDRICSNTGRENNRQCRGPTSPVALVVATWALCPLGDCSVHARVHLIPSESHSGVSAFFILTSMFNSCPRSVLPSGGRELQPAHPAWREAAPWR